MAPLLPGEMARNALGLVQKVWERRRYGTKKKQQAEDGAVARQGAKSRKQSILRNTPKEHKAAPACLATPKRKCHHLAKTAERGTVCEQSSEPGFQHRVLGTEWEGSKALPC